MESGFEAGTLWPQGRYLTTRPPRPYSRPDYASGLMDLMYVTSHPPTRDLPTAAI
ncbi:hypothetical protein AVEN_253580-1, partial [Araneus ventricosus]